MTHTLYVHYGDDWMRGSEMCLLNLMKGLDTRRFTPVLWTNNPLLHRQATQQGIHSELSHFGILFGWQGQRASLTQFGRQLAKAKALIQQHDIQLIHVNSGAPCQWMWLAARQCRIPMLTQLHSAYPLRDRVRLCLHLSPHVVTVSHAVSNQLISEGFPNQRLNVIHNGIDIDALQQQPIVPVKETLGLPADSIVMASVGSLIHRKGMDRLIRATETLVRSHKEIHLLIIGDGPEKTALQHLAIQLNIEDHVHFAGEQHHVCGWLSGGVDLFLSGAREEAFGLVLAEAALAGVPVVAPSVGGIPEVLQHNQSALLYNPGQTDQLIQYAEALLDDNALADKLSSCARERVLNTFSLDANTDKLTQLYEQLLTRHRSTIDPPGLLSGLKPLRNLSLAGLKH